jgi:O-antigen/teichoic acid export membrane protein
MKQANWKLLGFVALALGVLFLTVGFVTFSFEAEHWHGGTMVWNDYPYQRYSVGLLVVGAVLLVLGIVFLARGYMT